MEAWAVFPWWQEYWLALRPPWLLLSKELSDPVATNAHNRLVATGSIKPLLNLDQVLPDHQFLTVAFQLVTLGSFGPTTSFSVDLWGREVVMLMAQKMPQKTDAAHMEIYSYNCSTVQNKPFTLACGSLKSHLRSLWVSEAELFVHPHVSHMPRAPSAPTHYGAGAPGLLVFALAPQLSWRPKILSISAKNMLVPGAW